MAETDAMPSSMSLSLAMSLKDKYTVLVSPNICAETLELARFIDDHANLPLARRIISDLLAALQERGGNSSFAIQTMQQAEQFMRYSRSYGNVQS